MKSLRLCESAANRNSKPLAKIKCDFMKFQEFFPNMNFPWIHWPITTKYFGLSTWKNACNSTNVLFCLAYSSWLIHCFTDPQDMSDLLKQSTKKEAGKNSSHSFNNLYSVPNRAFQECLEKIGLLSTVVGYYWSGSSTIHVNSICPCEKMLGK